MYIRNMLQWFHAHIVYNVIVSACSYIISKLILYHMYMYTRIFTYFKLFLFQFTISIIVIGISLSASIPDAYHKSLAPILANLSHLTNNSNIFSQIDEIAQIGFVGIPGNFQ